MFAEEGVCKTNRSTAAGVAGVNNQSGTHGDGKAANTRGKTGVEAGVDTAGAGISTTPIGAHGEAEFELRLTL